MSDVELEIKKETQKQLEKLENEIKDISFDRKNKLLSEEIENLKAYISDTKHFLEKKDLIRAFEAIVFAWGIYETLLSMDLLLK